MCVCVCVNNSCFCILIFSDLVTYSGDESEIDDDDNDVNSLDSVRHIPKLELPSTVTVLDTEHGSKVYIVGTAHFSLESQEDVAKVNIYTEFSFL